MDYLVNFSDFLTSRFGQVGFRKPLVMGILNVTPDSFSDGGKFVVTDAGEAVGGRVDIYAAVTCAMQMVEEGADIIDIGGESSGPGSEDVSLEEELARVIPVVKKLSDVLGQKRTKVRNEFRPGAEMVEEFAGKKVLISVDTYKSEVARQAIFAGADMINDVTALRGDLDAYGVSKMASVLDKCPNVPVVIMYSKDPTARTTRENVQYSDVIATVRDFLEKRIAVGVAAGIARERFIIDPGMGAFVSGEPKYSFEILRRLGELDNFALPILIGASRKGFLGGVVDQRLEGSLACAAIAAYNGASILRVHDVKQTRRVVDMAAAIKNS